MREVQTWQFYQATVFRSRKKAPVGPLSGSVASHTDVELSRFDGKTHANQCSGGSDSFAGITRPEDDTDPMLGELSTYLQADSPVGSGNQRNFSFGHSLYPVVNHYIQVV
jgi:hypothetical protein